MLTNSAWRYRRSSVELSWSRSEARPPLVCNSICVVWTECHWVLALSIQDRHDRKFLLSTWISGTRSAEHRNNGVVVEDLPDRRAVGEPGSLNLSFGPNFALFAVFLNQTSVSDALSALIGAPASRNLKLNRNHDGSEAPMIRGLVRLLIAELDREDCDVSPALLGEIQPEIVKSRPDRAILSTLLFHALRREELVRAEGEGQDALSAAASGHPWTDQRLPRPATK
jgi:hypothetical protein